MITNVLIDGPTLTETTYGTEGKIMAMVGKKL